MTLGDLPSPRLAAVSSFVRLRRRRPHPGAALSPRPRRTAVVVALVGLFLTGAAVPNVAAVVVGIRQLVLGSAAAALTYAFGNLVGAGLG